MTETQTYAESLVQHTPSVCWTCSKLDIWYFHDHRDYCTKCYNKATMDCLLIMRDHDFVCQNIHFKTFTFRAHNSICQSIQIQKLLNYKTLLSINLHSITTHWYLLGSYR